VVRVRRGVPWGLVEWRGVTGGMTVTDESLRKLKKTQDHLEAFWMLAEDLDDEDKRKIQQARRLLYDVEMKADEARAVVG